MEKQFIMLTDEQFDQLKFKRNHFRDRAPFNGCMFETFGDELQEVLDSDVDLVCTIIEGDDGGLYVTNGYRLVNRLGYLILDQQPLDHEWEAEV